MPEEQGRTQPADLEAYYRPKHVLHVEFYYRDGYTLHRPECTCGWVHPGSRDYGWAVHVLEDHQRLTGGTRALDEEEDTD